MESRPTQLALHPLLPCSSAPLLPGKLRLPEQPEVALQSAPRTSPSRLCSPHSPLPLHSPAPALPCSLAPKSLPFDDPYPRFPSPPSFQKYPPGSLELDRLVL
jgi:hypothetical protein